MASDIFRDFDSPEVSLPVHSGCSAGRSRSVRMEFENQFVGVVLGPVRTGCHADPQGSGAFFHAGAVSSVSTQFYGWLAGLGTGAVIVSPENIRRDYVSFFKEDP